MKKMVGIRALLLRRGGGKEKRMFTPETLIIAWIIIVVIVEISEGQDFKIDNQLRILANDCYTRIAIGSRLPQTDVITSIRGNSLSDCESACTNNRTACNAFSFGIDRKGNGTCAIGRMDVNARGKDFIIDPNYDVYERRTRMPRGCQHDRLLRIGYEDGRAKTDSTISNGTERQRNASGSSPSKSTSPFGNIFTKKIASNFDSSREPSFFRGGWYSPTADDADTRLYDILNSEKNFNAEHPNEQTFHLNSSPYGFYHPTLIENSSIDTKKSNDPLSRPETTWNFHFSPFLSSPQVPYTEPKHSPKIHGQLDGTIGYGYTGIVSEIDSILDKSKREYHTESRKNTPNIYGST